MKTPKEYIKNLNNGIITDVMLSDVLFSYSKRAKNYRDKARELRALDKELTRYRVFTFHDLYEASEIASFRKEVLYERKSDILDKTGDKFLKCIHKQDKGARRRIYDYESAYERFEDSDEIIWQNCYFDEDEGREVWFIDVPADPPEYLYFKYYEYPSHSYHTPIEKEEAEELSKSRNIEIIEIDDLVTFGEDTDILLSLQFCDKVYKTLFPDKKIFKISQPVEFKHSYGYGQKSSCRFYTDEEIQEYRIKKQKQKEQAAIEKEQRRLERKKRTEELRKKREEEKQRRFNELSNILIENNETDWNIISKLLDGKNDTIFNKVFNKLKKDKKEKISNNALIAITTKYKLLPDEKIKIINDLPDMFSRMLLTLNDYYLSNKIDNYSNERLPKCFKFSTLYNEKKKETFIEFISSIIEINKLIIEQNSKIRFISNDCSTVYFLNVPLLGDIYIKNAYNLLTKETKEIFEHTNRNKKLKKRLKNNSIYIADAISNFSKKLEDEISLEKIKNITQSFKTK
jgi:hypothetical protein